MLDPLLDIFYDYASYELIQTLRCVCTAFTTSNNFWTRYYERVGLRNVFLEDVAECTHLVINENYSNYRFIITNREPRGPYGREAVSYEMTDLEYEQLHSNEGNFLRVIRGLNCKRILRRVVLEILIPLQLIENVLYDSELYPYYKSLI